MQSFHAVRRDTGSAPSSIRCFLLVSLIGLWASFRLYAAAMSVVANAFSRTPKMQIARLLVFSTALLGVGAIIER